MPTNCESGYIHQAPKSPKYFCSSMEGGHRISWMLEKWKEVVCAHREQPLPMGLLCTTLPTIASLYLSHVTGECFTFVMMWTPCSTVLWFANPSWDGIMGSSAWQLRFHFKGTQLANPNIPCSYMLLNMIIFWQLQWNTSLGPHISR